jgi:hypothetical protein
MRLGGMFMKLAARVIGAKIQERTTAWSKKKKRIDFTFVLL